MHEITAPLMGLTTLRRGTHPMLDGEAIRNTFMAQAKGETPQYEELLAVKKAAGE
jgi:hypothetical protein